MDHFVLSPYSLYEIAESFSNLGGELLCLDEIHKYESWSKELKSIHDTFPNLRIVASGSSAMEISKGSHDLSRRAIVHHLPGLSFREFIGLKTQLPFDPFQLQEIYDSHEKKARSIIQKLENRSLKVLALFRDYLEYGYFPYFQEFDDVRLYYATLQQNIHYTIESDLCSVYPFLNGTSVRKISKLLSIIAGLVPFTPDLKNLKRTLEIGDERTLKTYLKYLEDSGIIRTLSKTGRGLRELEKPEKLYLDNPSQIFALSGLSRENRGTLRETFFLSMLSHGHRITIPEHGDFLIDDDSLVEVGGKGKSFSQIRNKPKSFLALDDMESGFGDKIPLWIFGFLY